MGFDDEVVLVTGGTGSFGKTVTRSLLEWGCREVRVLSRDEAKQDLMRTEFGFDGRLRFFLGDVRDYRSVEHAVAGASAVFHAAALKQVPSCEFFPMQAVLTNVTGSANVLEAAAKAGVKRCVCLSTDKAVYPVNAMGLSKALMEKVALSNTRFHTTPSDFVVTCVRYGNVLYSRGSVVPRFIEQLKIGRPLTITEPSMTRFLLRLDESVDLVQQALTNGTPGDIFIKKAPACTIETLAQALAELFEVELEIQVIGIRHGEKIYESLVSKEEMARSEDLGDYFRIRMDDRELNYEKYFEQGDVDEIEFEDYTSHNTTRFSVEDTKKLLLMLPEVRQELEEWARR